MEGQANHSVTGLMLTPVLNKKILSLYSRGLSFSEIQDHLRNSYHVDMPVSSVSMAAGPIHDEFRSWQDSTLDEVYPIVYLDSLPVKFREGVDIRNHVVLFAMAIDVEGRKCPLGLWTTPNEDAHAWQQVVETLMRRGVKDILIACVYGQHTVAGVLSTLLPRTETQLCIARLIDHTLNFTDWKDRKAVAAVLRTIYAAGSALLGASAMQIFMDNWDFRYPLIGQIWRAHWNDLGSFFAQPAPVREVLYSTNVIQTVHRALRKVVRRHGVFTDVNDLLARLYLVESQLTRRWPRPLRHWKQALNSLPMKYGRRMGI